MPGGAVRCHAGLGSALVAPVLESDDLVALGQHVRREDAPVLVRHFDADGGTHPVLLLRLSSSFTVIVRFILLITSHKVLTKIIPFLPGRRWCPPPKNRRRSIKTGFYIK